ncbi:MAG: DUF503 domain-containing protein [Deltaproteobacteria bacterium]|jgi:uncharacterized protein YlxP (DUF503 family)|nr:DUF503 domain-containing protein [Deltaproteobacteria bacterium]
MVIGFLEVTLDMPGNQSLKDKRRVLKSVMGRVKAKFNVSAAEVALCDNPRVGLIGFSVCGSDGRVLESVLERLLNFVEDNADAVVRSSRKQCAIMD